MEPFGYLTSRDRRWPSTWVPSLWWWPFVAGLLFLLSTEAIRLISLGGVAIWWPAGGVSIWFALVNPPRRRAAAVLLILVVTTTANWNGGRGVATSVFFGLANAAEVVSVIVVLGWLSRPFVLDSVQRGLEFILAIGVGGLVVGVIAGTTVHVVSGGDLLTTALRVATSHAAAGLLIAPLAVLPRGKVTSASRWEVAVQTATLGGAVWLAFAPAHVLPLAFVPFPAIAWAALRFPPLVVYIQSLVTGLSVLVLTISGAGPFAAALIGEPEAVLVMVIFLTTLGAFSILLSVAHVSLEIASRTAEDANLLLSGGFVGTQVGMVVAEVHAGQAFVVWANDFGAEAIANELTSTLRWSGPIERQSRVGIGSEVESLYTADGSARTLSLISSVLPGPDDRFAVQILDVTETVELAAAKLAAEREHAAAQSQRRALEQQRDDFVATTSHELRTPITSILGYGELLEESEDLGATERGWVHVINRNGKRLAEIIENLLVLEKVSAAGVVERPETDTDVATAIEEVVDAQLVQATARDLSLVVNPGCRCRVRADASDLNRILTNLVSNAIKFTPAGGRVTVSTACGEETVSIAVSDTGPGMSAQVLEHARERFFRGPDVSQKAVPGTGLGLAIASELAEANRGRLTLESPESGGLVATLVLPLSTSVATASEGAHSVKG